MDFMEHQIEGGKVVEISSDEVVIQSEKDALVIMSDTSKALEVLRG